MKVRITVAVVFLAITIALCGVGIGSSFLQEKEDVPTTMVKEDYSFKVMSFNVRTINLDLSGHPNDNIQLRSPLIIEQIRAESPDLIGCQEWTASHEAFIQKKIANDYGYIVISRDGLPFGEMGAIFYKKARFELLENHTFWLSDTPEKISLGWDGGCHRICTTAVLKDLKSEKTLQFSNTHLDNKGIEAREKGTKMVVKEVEESSYPSILVGDFNYNNFNANYAYCIEKLDDARLIAEKSVTTATYNNWNENSLSIGGYPIDHVMLKKDCFLVEEYKVLNYLVNDLFASDHFALVVTLSIK